MHNEGAREKHCIYPVSGDSLLHHKCLLLLLYVLCWDHIMSKCYLYVYKLATIVILVLYMGENFQTCFRFIFKEAVLYNHAYKTNWLMHVEQLNERSVFFFSSYLLACGYDGNSFFFISKFIYFEAVDQYLNAEYLCKNLRKLQMFYMYIYVAWHI